MANLGDNPAAIAEALLDFNQPLNIELLDQVVNAFFSGNADSQKILTPFTEHELAWTRVDTILDKSSSPHSRMVALRILDNCIERRWNSLSHDQTVGIKNYIVGIILKISGDEKLMKQQSTFLKRLNVVLVNIAKREWPQNWPSFIPDLVESSKTSMTICANNIQILQLLSEEVFDFSRGRLTNTKITEMKVRFKSDLTMIFELCWYILNQSESLSLLEATLKTLLRFLSWVPQEFIFERYPLVEVLVCKFFPVDVFRFKILALQCLTEISSLTRLDKPEYEAQYRDMMIQLMKHVYRDIPDAVDLDRTYKAGTTEQQLYLRHLTNFITEFCRHHVATLETTPGDAQQSLLAALRVLLRISMIDDSDQGSEVVLFNTALDYWVDMVRRIYKHKQESASGPRGIFSGGFGSFNNPIVGTIGSIGAGSQAQSTTTPMLTFYEDIMINLRQVLISKMAKPEEVLVVEDENGNITRERVQNSDSFSLYITMREALIYITNLSPANTIQAMLTQLAFLTSQLETVSDSDKWDPKPLNRLCWAIGSISRALPENDEKTFLVQVLKGLLAHIKKCTRSEHKAVGAANVMYIVGQHPRFLRKHQKFLNTVLSKLFEFMHEPFPGVKDMCCDTLIKIAQKCKRTIVAPFENNPIIVAILTDTERNISDLEPSQMYTYYEAVACMISAEHNLETRHRYLDQLMVIPNKSWVEMTTRIKINIQELWNPEAMDLIDRILKTNIYVARALKEQYLGQLSRITLEMLTMYQMYSSRVSEEIKAYGETATRTSIIRKMRSVKKDVLTLITTVVNSSSANTVNVILKEILPQLFDPVVLDYSQNVPEARDAEVLDLFTAFIKQFKSQMQKHVPAILANVFSPTLKMITTNFEDFPEHRKGLFSLLDAIVSFCFPVLLNQQEADFRLVVDTAVWAMKHLESSAQLLGLSMIQNILLNFQQAQPDFAQQCYSMFLVPIISELLDVLTDTFHRTGFSEQCSLLFNIVKLVNMGAITVPLAPGVTNNQAFIIKHIGDLLRTSFPALPNSSLNEFLNGLFFSPTINTDLAVFKSHTDNFLIALRGYAGSQQNPNEQEPALWESEQQLSLRVEENARRAQEEPTVRGLDYARFDRNSYQEDDDD